MRVGDIMTDFQDKIGLTICIKRGSVEIFKSMMSDLTKGASYLDYLGETYVESDDGCKIRNY